VSHADGQMLAIAAAVFAAAVLFLLRQRLGSRLRGSDWQLQCRSCGDTHALVTVSRRLPVGRLAASRIIRRDGRHSRRLFLHWCERCGWWRFGIARPAAPGRASGAAR